MERTNKPVIVGILNIVSGVLGLIWAILLFIGFGVTSGTFNIPGIWGIPYFVPTIIISWAIPSLILAILALISGILAIQRRGWGLSIAGSIAAIFIFFPLGILAVILSALAKDDFE